MDFDVATLSRFQFALTALYHFLFIPLTLGLSALVATIETVYYFTNKPIWRQMTKFWGTLFGINFVLGVSTGIVMEFQFGMNWSYYSHYVGDIFGAPLAIEGLMAFFLESTFVGLFFFGWDRMSRGAHLVAAWCVAIGSNFSALWILIANGWMQNPTGSVFNPATMRMEVSHFADVLFNPVAQAKFVHTVSAGYCTAAAFVIGVSAWYILKGRHLEIAKRSIAVASAFGLCAALSVVFLGDESGYMVGKDQPMKMAAIEGMWDTEPAPASFMLIGFTSQNSDEETARTQNAGSTSGGIHIPIVMGLIGTRTLTQELAGINELAFGRRLDGKESQVETSVDRIRSGLVAYNALQQIRQEYGSYGNAPAELKALVDDNIRNYGYALLLRGPTAASEGGNKLPDLSNVPESEIMLAAAKTIPHVATAFWSFRIMVAIGFYLILFMLVFFFMSARRTLEKHPFMLRLAVWSIPLPWIAAEMGWMVAEMGRQPWIIEGVLPTVSAHSELGAWALLLTIAGFALIYTVLIIVEMSLMVKSIRKGPQPEPGSPEALQKQANEPKLAAAE
ncbi:Cytochrome bd ubiquinol oxidase subunit 1 [Saezia sanguinis]|uniref:Cytochrome bd ubiquinol oxidase subunit 1 n=1 Tax=Saezia sanguinis TaxID=1965230 RepID=A0A433SDX2_9BURK|nr:cytochrome ubiquinol oxidase subunit I [Saezia sanguinis]RUS66886.1 Cytochrome bd ubiquinol oxidase subunit 1 [Saezia sanguinis]